MAAIFDQYETFVCESEEPMKMVHEPKTVETTARSGISNADLDDYKKS